MSPDPELTQTESGHGPRPPGAIIPTSSISGTALVAVVAIMTFLAALAVGAVGLVYDAATDWRSDVAREMTIQVRPVEGRNLTEDVRRAGEVARAAPGIVDVRVYSQAEAEHLLEPWLGAGLDLTGLPVPRLIGLQLGSGGLDSPALRRQLAEKVPNASLDDHRAWSAYLVTMADTVVAAGIAVTGLVLVATALCVAFATRGAVSVNRNVVEVLHLVGAKDSFIAVQFQRHFLLLGLRGAATGGAVAMVLFLLIGALAGSGLADGTGGAATLIGGLALPGQSYLLIVALVLTVAAVTATTTRVTVRSTLRSFD
ncbi:cell division protein FtsX [Blastochloris viridis]|uniref:Cell division ABC transporter subunit FtsX n=1 Tax=Blastochloris viridis TaxID=1079 RepID=A0A0H5B962_BLAVI|nr:ABC transporter permease [Blastochloris viridis]ALK07982.1 cell division ABC transporter subunit FtsX [Blastochloris viridis]BAR98762.1 cell division protein FtsX [Blastochloris viridis]CUU43904.1 cell division ABC transporter subunit FtsX [Blastochloris viridis]